MIQDGRPAADAPAEERVLSREAMIEAYGPPRRFRLVFTNGVFDLLHRGHAACLEAARRLGDALVVGVNSDASARRLKGPGRPVQPEEDRAFLVASLRCVDAVCLFGDDTPRSLVVALLPDVLVKGGDYAPEEVAGGDVVREAGGSVRIVPLEPGRSTSSLIERLRGPEDGS